MIQLSGVQSRAKTKLTRKWQKASEVKERLDTMWALYQKGYAEIKVQPYCFLWRKKIADIKH
jgi:hypothetical protein